MAVRRRRVASLLGVYCAVAAVAAGGVAWRWGATPAAWGQAAAPAAADPSAEAYFHDTLRPILSKYCFECHNSTDKVADLALDTLASADTVVAKRNLWDLISKYVRTQQMPPDDHPQPTETERATLTKWIDGQLYAYYASHPDPGRVTIKRMNRSEYNNTIRDLVGVDFEPGADFPQDDSGYGFDNIGDVLSLPPVLMEKYMAAADKVLDEALPTEPPVSKVRHYAAAQTEVGFNAIGDRGDGWVQLISLEEDDVAVELPVPAGDYIVRLKAFSTKTGGALVGMGSSVPIKFAGEVEPTKLGIFVGDTFVQDITIDAAEDAPKVYEARVGVAKGKNRFRASVRRNRGGDNETYMLNGRVGKQQPGIVYVKFLEIEGPLPAAIQRFPARKLEVTGGGLVDPQGGLVMDKNGEAGVTVNVPAAGEYVLRGEAASKQAGDEPVKMEFRVNGQVAQAFAVIAPAALVPLPNQRLFDINLLNARPYVYEAKVQLPAGPVKVSAAFVNAFENPAAANPNLRKRTLILNYLELVNPREPLPVAAPPAPFARFLATTAPAGTRDAAREVLTAFTRRAYRRPAAPAAVDRLVGLYDLARREGESHESGLKLALKAVLVSPHFLFRGEQHPDPDNPTAVHTIDEFALASRLSYFLWSSTPDDELLGLAERGELRKNLDGQVRRLLASPKAQSLVENFAGQWLQLRNLPNLAPDKAMFREYDDGLRRAMGKETELLFNSIVRDDKSVLDFLTADYTFVNGRLAKFYGIKDVTGEEFVKVSLADTPRRGVLTQASILTLTSNPTRTSPVKRGKFVLENLLGTPPPPPPPDVPKLEDQHAVTGTLRQQMEAHRQNPACASCHAQMDPIGFGLENFDAIGRWRDKDGQAPVDAAGKLKSGEEFKDAVQLSAILVDRKKDDFVHCLAEKMMTYALGRGVEAYDRPAVEGVVKAMDGDGDRFSALVLAIVKSMPFQMERGEAPQ